MRKADCPFDILQILRDGGQQPCAPITARRHDFAVKPCTVLQRRGQTHRPARGRTPTDDQARAA